MPIIRKSITFGLELEAVRATPEADAIVLRNNFEVHPDHSIRDDQGRDLGRGPASGKEFVTPVLRTDVSCGGDGTRMQINFNDTERVVRDLCACAEYVNKSCGVHVHLGKPNGDSGSVWEPARVRAFLGIAQILETRLFDLVPPSRKNNEHCTLIKDRYEKRDFARFYPVGVVENVKYNNRKRYCWLNLIETARRGEGTSLGTRPGLGTIEIRLLGNTRRFNYIWAWTKLWVKIAAYVGCLEPSLSVLQCGMSDILDGDFAAVAAAKRESEIEDSKEESLVRPISPFGLVNSASAEVGERRSEIIDDEGPARIPRMPTRRRRPPVTAAADHPEF